MIIYSLRCAEGHAFDSWFASAGAYDALAEAGRLSCAICGNARVDKAMMAPRVATRETAAPVPGPERAPPPAAPNTPMRPLAAPASALEEAVAELRARVEASTEDVGARFAAEARAIHDGTAPERAIRGEANRAEAKALLEDGVPVLPLPFPAPRQVN